MKPMRKCNHVSCRALVDFDQRYCEKHVYHRKATDSLYNRNRRREDPEYVRFYKSREWQDKRLLALLRDDYVCVHCRAEGIHHPADEVDHIIDTKDDWSKRLDLSNLQSLCGRHHRIKTFGRKAPPNFDPTSKTDQGTVGGSSF